MLRKGGPLITVLLLLAASAGLALLIMEVTAAGEPRVEFTDSTLLVSNRSARSLCVDAAAGATLTGSAVANLEEALVLFREDLAGRPFEETVLSRGCPPPAAEDPANRYPDPDGQGPTTIQGPTTLRPSKHRVHVYIVSKDTLRDWFGDVPYGLAGEEMFCGDPPTHNCGGVTVGLYITSGMSAEAIKEALRDAFGLVSPFERIGLPTPTPAPAAAPGP